MYTFAMLTNIRTVFLKLIFQLQAVSLCCHYFKNKSHQNIHYILIKSVNM